MVKVLKFVNKYLLLIVLISFLYKGVLHAAYPIPYDGLWLGADTSLSDDPNNSGHYSWATLGLKLTGRYNTTPPASSLMGFIESLGNNILDSAYTANYIDIMVRRMLDGDTSTEITYNSDTYAYTGGYEAKAILDRQCIDVMIRKVCFNVYVTDIDGDGKIVTYDNTSANTYIQVRGDTGTDGSQRTKDDGLDLTVSLGSIGVDILVEPPLNSELPSNESLNYLCSDEDGTHPIAGCITDTQAESDDYTPRILDNYVKAKTVAQVPQIIMTIGLQVQSAFEEDDPDQPHSRIGINLERLDVQGDFQMVLQSGPFCSSPHTDALGHSTPTDNENNCYNSGGHIYPDATQDASNFASELIPYINAELKVDAKDIWQDDTAGTPGYYFGPTMLFELNQDMLSSIAISSPLYPNPNSITVALSLRNSDSHPSTSGGTDSYGDFWTDYYGNTMIFDVGMRFGFLDADTGNPLPNPMQDTGSLSGYVDGWGHYVGTTWNNNTTDDPSSIMTSTNQNIQFKDGYGGYTTTNGTIRSSTRGVLWYERMPILPGPWDVKTYSDVYSVGLAVHQNLLNKLLYDAVVKGLLNVTLDGDSSSDTTGGVGGFSLGSILNTGFFKYIFPSLATKFPDAPMYVRGYPTLQNYTSGVQTHQMELHNLLDRDLPYIVVGGPKITTMNYNLMPNITLVIPNYMLQFYVYDKDSGNILRRAFGINTTIVVGLAFDLLDTSSVTLPSGFSYTGTWYPIGCDSDGNTSDCDVQADTLRVLRVSGMIHPFVNSVLTYNEMDNYTTSNAFPNQNYYANGIAQILGVLLNMRLDLNAEIGFDPGVLLDMPISMKAVKIGPSYVANNGTTNLSDGDNNGYGDYLEIGLQLQQYFGTNANLTSKYVLALLDKLMSGGALSSLGLAPGLMKNYKSWNYNPSNISPYGYNELFNQPIIDKQKYGFNISVNDSFPEGWKLSYRLDNGLWSPYTDKRELVFENIPEGWHNISFTFKGEGVKESLKNNISYEFLTDYTPPVIKGLKIDPSSNSALVSVIARDKYTPSNALRVSYKLDNGSWVTVNDVNFKVPVKNEGHHSISVKVEDSQGNESVTGKTFEITDGFGCTSAPLGIDWFMLILIFISGFVFLKKSVKNS